MQLLGARDLIFGLSIVVLPVACTAPAAGGGGGPAGAGGGADASGGETAVGGSAAGGADQATGGSGGNTPRPPGTPTLPNGRGATVHFVTYEAEDMNTSGAVLGPSRTFGQVAAEASGRRAVRLSSQGHHLEFTNATPSNSIVVRYSIPDGGLDYWTTLTVLVDDEVRAKLDVTSRYSWTYGDEYQFNTPAQNDPASGHPHHFFDETRALIGDIPVGAKVTLRKDSGDDAAHYDIDLVEMEEVPEPLPKPEGYVSITDPECGATPNDGTDDSVAIQTCIDLAIGQSAGLYIPPGVFHSHSQTLEVNTLSIRGAGMWHSTIAGYHARFSCWNDNCRYYDFSVFGDTTQRIDDSPENAFQGNGSSNVILENIWIEHVKVGYWTGPATTNLRIAGCRMRNLYADGVNFYGGTNNSVVENSHFRNTGDDALAAWSHAHDDTPAGHDNVFRHNYVQVPWKANCFGLYGGTNNVVEDNVCADTVQYPGLLLSRMFNSHAFGGMNDIERNTLVRAGGFTYDQPHGAFKLHAAQGNLQNVTVRDLDILEPTYAAIHVQGPGTVDSVWLDGVTIEHPGDGSFLLNASSTGALDAVNVVATGDATHVINDSTHGFNLIRGAGSTGW